MLFLRRKAKDSPWFGFIRCHRCPVAVVGGQSLCCCGSCLILCLSLQGMQTHPGCVHHRPRWPHAAHDQGSPQQHRESGGFGGAGAQGTNSSSLCCPTRSSREGQSSWAWLLPGERAGAAKQAADVCCSVSEITLWWDRLCCLMIRVGLGTLGELQASP